MFRNHNPKRFSLEELLLFAAPLLVIGLAYGTLVFLEQRRQNVPPPRPIVRAPRQPPGNRLVRWSGSGMRVAALAFSPDGQLVASASGGEVELWSVHKKTPGRQPTLRKVLTLPEAKVHTPAGQPPSIRGGVAALAFSPDGKMLAVGSQYETFVSASIAPDGRTVNQIKASGIVDFYSVSSGRVVRTLRSSRPILSLAFAPDGKSVATGEGQWGQGAVRLWDIKTGQQRWMMPKTLPKTLPTGNSRVIKGNQWSTAAKSTPADKDGAAVESVAIAPDGKTVASFGAVYGLDNFCSLRLWNARTGALMRRLYDGRQGSGSSLNEHSVLSFSPDGRIIAINQLGTSVGREGITLLDVQTGTAKSQKALPDVTVYAVAFSPDGRTVVGAGAVDPFSPNRAPGDDHRGNMHFWDVKTGKAKGSSKHADTITCVAFSPDGRTLAVGTEGFFSDEKVQVIDVSRYIR